MKNLLIITTLLISTHSFAKLNIRGFGTAGVSVTDDNDALLRYKTGSKPDFSRLSKMGLNLTNELTNEYTFAAQLIAKDRVEDDKDFTLKEDWVFIKYQASKNTSFRFGKLRLPIWLISDYLDVGYLYPWTESPIEVYSQSSFNNGNGISAQHIFRFDSFDLKAELFFTNSNFTQEFTANTFGVGIAEDFTVMNVEANFEWLLLKATHAYANDVKGNTFVSGGVPGTDARLKIPFDTKYKFTNIAIKIDKRGWEVYSEFAQSGSNSSIQEAIFKAQYLTIGRRINKLFVYLSYNIYLYDFRKSYSVTSNSVTVTTPEYESNQNSIHFGTNYQLSSNTIFKVQVSKYSVDESNTYTIIAGAPQSDDLSTGSFAKNTGRDINVLNATLDFVF